MIVLALDSSADLLSVALIDDGEPRAERTRLLPRPSSEGLLPAIAGVLSDARATLESVTLVAVATGPGSFNGIRGGIATAEGLALALGIAAVGVPTLDAVAYAHAGRAPLILAVSPAGRGEYYGATYAGTWEEWRRQSDYTLASPADFLDGLPAGTLVCGRVAAGDILPARHIVRAPAFTRFSPAVLIAALADRRAAAADFDARASLQPLYLRRPGITRSTKAVVGRQ